MSNFYAIYLSNPKSADAYKDFCRKKYPQTGVYYFFLKASDLPYLPDEFKKERVGLRPNFIGILLYTSDAATFPKSYYWPGVTLQHIYSQDNETDAWARDKINQIPFFRPYKQHLQLYENLEQESYYKLQRQYLTLRDEVEYLEEAYQSELNQWKQRNAQALIKATREKEQIESEIKAVAMDLTLSKLASWKASNPGYTQLQAIEKFQTFKQHFFVQTKIREPWKSRLAPIEALLSTIPQRNEELKTKKEKVEFLEKYLESLRH